MGDRNLSQSDWPTLQGPHNAQNVGAAMRRCRLLGLDDDQIAEGLRTYPGLPHRMERIREKDGVLFVNDSKATNPTATAPALAAFERIRWICGGQAKTDNLDECAPHFGHVRSAYTIGEAGELFARLLSPHMSVKNCGKLDEAVRQAAADAEAGDTVLLSPACASFDQFRDFEDRGDQFRALVEGIMIKTISGQIKARAAFMDPDRYGRSDTSAIGRWFWEIDKVLLLLVSVLIGIGLIAVAAASPAAAQRYSGGNVRFDELYYFWRQLAWIAIGIPVMIGISMMPRERARRFSLFGAAFFFVLLDLRADRRPGA